MNWWAVGWIIIFVVGVVIEIAALIRGSKRDTLSEQVWTFRQFKLGKFLLFPAWFWLSWHFLFEPYNLAITFWWDDIFVLIIGAVAAFFVRYPRRLLPNKVVVQMEELERRKTADKLEREYDKSLDERRREK